MKESAADNKQALNGFTGACDIAGMKIGTFKIEIFRLSKNLIQCSLQVDAESLKQIEKLKYLGVAFTRDGKHDREFVVRLGIASAVIQALHCSVVITLELSKKAKLLVFKISAMIA